MQKLTSFLAVAVVAAVACSDAFTLQNRDGGI
jgi:hypothetical protein